jgi:hypothetical protein
MAAGLALGVMVGTGPSWAQGAAAAGSEDKAAAQVLFDEGRTLMDAKNYAPACDKFAESQRLDPAYGTQLNLARCYQLMGRTASSWINYVEAAATAKREGRADREQTAKKFAEELRPKLSKMTIAVTERVAGLEIRRDGTLVRDAQWGSPVPVDPGTHEIRATAPGFNAWSKKVEIGDNAAVLAVTVDKLTPAPKDVKLGGGTEGAVPESDNSAQLGLGVTAGVLGLGGLALGIGLGVTAGNQNSDSKAYCRADNPNLCSQDGVDLRDKARTSGTVSTVGFVAGGVLLVAGIVLIATAFGGGDETSATEPGAEPAETPPKDESARWSLVPMVGFGPADGSGSAETATVAGMTIQGRW